MKVAERVADEIEVQLGLRPHLVLSNLKRTKLDPNREVNEAAQGNAEAVQAYETFHGFIETASEAVGRGVLFDLHGQSHEQNSTECGYLVRTEDLNSGNYRF